MDCMYWTKEVGDAISRGSLPEYADQCTDELMKIVNKVSVHLCLDGSQQR